MSDFCKYGFSCASMMQQPGLTAEECPNRDVCGIIRQLSHEEEIEFHRRQEIIRISPLEAARFLLESRGCSQTPASLGIIAAIDELKNVIARLELELESYTGEYIAPAGVEAHRYGVKRGDKTYWYNKLTATNPIFPPQQRENLVKVIHLSLDSDPRNDEGRAGIARRNRLLQIRTAIDSAARLLSSHYSS